MKALDLFCGSGSVSLGLLGDSLDNLIKALEYLYGGELYVSTC